MESKKSMDIQVQEFFKKGMEALFLISKDDLPLFCNFLISHMEPGDWVFLEGDLGSGKTTFVQNMCQNMNFMMEGSPTYGLLHILKPIQNPSAHWGTVSIKVPNTLSLQTKQIIHMDVYRMESWQELLYLGLEQEFGEDTLCFVEWSQRFSQEIWDEFFTTLGIEPKRRWILSIDTPLNEAFLNASNSMQIKDKKWIQMHNSMAQEAVSWRNYRLHNLHKKI